MNLNKNFNNELICGDCEKEMLSLIKKDIKVDCIITDPPYGVNFKNDIYIDTEEEIFNKIPKWFECWFNILKEDGFLYIFTSVKTIHKWIEAGIKSGFTYKNIIATRSFNNGSMRPKNNFGFQFQPVLVFSKGKGRNFNEYDFFPTSEAWFNDPRNKKPKKYSYEYPNWIKTEWAFSTAKRSIKNFHPNEKNVDFIKLLVGISTNEDDVVLDSFMGSCSTGIACKELGRKFIGIEINRDCFNIGKIRFENYLTNKK